MAMEQKALLEHNLFLLMLNLSQMKDRALVLKVFIESLNSMDFPTTFRLAEEGDAETEFSLLISTASNCFGKIALEAQTGEITPEQLSTMQNAVSMLAIILENMYRNEMLEENLKRLEISIKERTTDLETAINNYRALFNSVSGGIVVQDKGGNIVEANSVGCDLLKLKKDKILGLTSGDEIWNSIDSQGKALFGEEHPISVSLRTGKSIRNFIMGLYADDPEQTLWINVSSEPLKNDEGETTGAVATFIDVTELKTTQDALERLNNELEKRVDERTALLEQSNRELESFSYTVSHDLRTPLRSINGFITILEQEHGESLNAEAKETIERVKRASVRMSHLIDSLLNLSRINRKEIVAEDINLSSLCMEIADELNRPPDANKVELDIEPEIFARGDRNLIRTVIYNLFDNAWKYTRYSPKPKVSFSMSDENGRRVFTVSDNGSGFDMQYSGRLFGAFQRLHRDDEFEGTGIGLATVKRIIARHNGEVWGEGKPGYGAAFHFTIGETSGSVTPRQHQS